MTGKHLRVPSPRARRRRLIGAAIDTIIGALTLTIIVLGVMALLGCAAEAAANLMRA